MRLVYGRLFLNNPGYIQLECNSLQSLTSALHDLFSGGRRTCETDLCGNGMRSQQWAQALIAAERLHNTWWKELLRNLGHFQAAVRSERRGFQDDGISSQNRRDQLIQYQEERKVPWDDANGYTKWRVANCDLTSFCIFDDLWLEIEINGASQALNATSDLPCRKR